MNAECDRTQRHMRLQKAVQRQGVLYTLNDGACPVWVVKLYCEGLSLSYPVLPECYDI